MRKAYFFCPGANDFALVPGVLRSPGAFTDFPGSVGGGAGCVVVWPGEIEDATPAAAMVEIATRIGTGAADHLRVLAHAEIVVGTTDRFGRSGACR